jgi:hypothetical protein
MGWQPDDEVIEALENDNLIEVGWNKGEMYPIITKEESKSGYLFRGYLMACGVLANVWMIYYLVILWVS